LRIKESKFIEKGRKIKQHSCRIVTKQALKRNITFLHLMEIYLVLYIPTQTFHPCWSDLLKMVFILFWPEIRHTLIAWRNHSWHIKTVRVVLGDVWVLFDETFIPDVNICLEHCAHFQGIA